MGGERPIEHARAEGEREGYLAVPSLGFPIVFMTLLAHGFGIFVVRQGYWSPGPTAELLWTGLLVVGIGAGLGISAWRCAGLNRN